MPEQHDETGATSIQLLAQRFDAGEAPEPLLRARAAAVDALIRDTWAQSIPDNANLALFAVGGYGRGELYPHSDIDLMRRGK